MLLIIIIIHHFDETSFKFTTILITGLDNTFSKANHFDRIKYMLAYLLGG